MRTFVLNRLEDETGISGAGIIAEGVEYSDGLVVLRWVTDTPTTEICPDLKTTMFLHGHKGRTVAVFHDEIKADGKNASAGKFATHVIPKAEPPRAIWPLE